MIIAQNEFQRRDKAYLIARRALSLLRSLELHFGDILEEAGAFDVYYRILSDLEELDVYLWYRTSHFQQMLIEEVRK